MKTLLILIGVAVVGLVTYISNDPFYVAGGSDVTEEIVQLSQAVRFGAAGAAIVALLFLLVRSNLASVLIAFACLAVFVLAHNTVRVSGKSFAVVQTLAMVPLSRISVVEGEGGDIAEGLFRGIGPLSLPENELTKSLSGLRRAN